MQVVAVQELMVAALLVLAALAVAHQVAQAVAAQAAQVQSTQEVVVAVAAVERLELLEAMVATAVQASSSFHTQAQHNYLVVALLPNQAVTSFTHSHLLAHLALCHL
jgi:hypothetical protein